MIKGFENWHKVKPKIDSKENRTIFFEREIWWCNLGVNIGYEQDGKGSQFARPVLILKKYNSKLLLAVPLSSKIKENNPHYLKFSLNQKEQSVLLHQVKTIDSKRLLSKMFRISEAKFNEIKEIVIKNML